MNPDHQFRPVGDNPAIDIQLLFSDLNSRYEAGLTVADQPISRIVNAETVDSAHCTNALITFLVNIMTHSDTFSEILTCEVLGYSFARSVTNGDYEYLALEGADIVKELKSTIEPKEAVWLQEFIAIRETLNGSLVDRFLTLGLLDKRTRPGFKILIFTNNIKCNKLLLAPKIYDKPITWVPSLIEEAALVRNARYVSDKYNTFVGIDHSLPTLTVEDLMFSCSINVDRAPLCYHMLQAMSVVKRKLPVPNPNSISLEVRSRGNIQELELLSHLFNNVTTDITIVYGQGSHHLFSGVIVFLELCLNYEQNSNEEVQRKLIFPCEVIATFSGADPLSSFNQLYIHQVPFRRLRSDRAVLRTLSHFTVGKAQQFKNVKSASITGVHMIPSVEESYLYKLLDLLYKNRKLSAIERACLHQETYERPNIRCCLREPPTRNTDIMKNTEMFNFLTSKDVTDGYSFGSTKMYDNPSLQDCHYSAFSIADAADGLAIWGRAQSPNVEKPSGNAVLVSFRDRDPIGLDDSLELLCRFISRYFEFNRLPILVLTGEAELADLYLVVRHNFSPISGRPKRVLCPTREHVVSDFLEMARWMNRLLAEAERIINILRVPLTTEGSISKCDLGLSISTKSRPSRPEDAVDSKHIRDRYHRCCSIYQNYVSAASSTSSPNISGEPLKPFAQAEQVATLGMLLKQMEVLDDLFAIPKLGVQLDHIIRYLTHVIFVTPSMFCTISEGLSKMRFGACVVTAGVMLEADVICAMKWVAGNLWWFIKGRNEWSDRLSRISVSQIHIAPTKNGYAGRAGRAREHIAPPQQNAEPPPNNNNDDRPNPPS